MIEHFEDRIARSIGEKISEFQNGNRLRHVIFSGQFNQKMIVRLMKTAAKIAALSRNSNAKQALTHVLEGRSAVLYFTQPSTRTYASFVKACQILGVDYVSFQNEQVSSASKGEAVMDTVRMFSTYNDVLIMRSPVPNLSEASAYLMNDLSTFNDGETRHIINGGAGTDEHPTQALLDIFSITQAFDFSSTFYRCNGKTYSELKQKHSNLLPGLEGKHFCFVGDLGRGRTVHSLISLLCLYPGIRLSFVSPDVDELKIPDQIRKLLERQGVQFIETHNFDDVIYDADMLYVTRRQEEYDRNKTSEQLLLSENQNYIVDRPLIEKMKEYAIVMHPLPRRNELSLSVDNNHRAKYFDQVKNGMWVRAALLCHLFDVDDVIQEIYEEHGFETYRKAVDYT